MWWWGEQEAPGATKWLEDTIAAYKAEKPNITIDTVLQTTDGLMPAFEAAAAAKQGPDLQYFWGGVYSQQPFWDGSIVPVSDYIPADELQHYTNAQLEDSNAGKILTAPWYVNPSFPVLVRNDVLDSNGLTVPETWDDLLKACDVLSAKGITTLAGGVKDGWFGGWLYSMLGAQSVESSQDVTAAVLGDKSFTDPEQADWWIRLEESREHNCWNDDINSLELYQAQQLWVQGDAAMTITAGTDAPNFVDKVGADKVTVMALPKWGDGPYAGKMGTTSQTVGITSWSKYPQVAADFIQFMHTPERLQAWYDETGSLPADDRFDIAKVDDPVKKDLFNSITDGAPYLENFIPPALDSKSVFTGVQLVLEGSKSAADAAADMQAEAERLRTTDRSLVKNFEGWSE
jgi:ABC-type glycerol-3-phosphate transport system substrate-binding protein